MAKHYRKPYWLDRKRGYIGEPPYSASVGIPGVQNFRYLNHWTQNQFLFSFSQPVDAYHGDQADPTNYVDGYYYVILGPPPKADTSNPQRQIQGALLPWSYLSVEDVVGPSYTWTDNPLITWQQDGGGVETLLDKTMWGGGSSLTLDYSTRLKNGDYIFLGDEGTFLYTPDAAGGYTYGRLRTHQIRTATLTLWPGTEYSLTADQAQISTTPFQSMHTIRGYTSTASKRSLGNLIHNMGTAVVTDDDIFQSGRRNCVFSWGHPCGIWSDTNAYTHLKDSSTTYTIGTRGLYNSSYSASEYTADVVVCITVTGASEGDAAGVRVSSVTAADTCTIETETDTVAWDDAATFLYTGQLDLASAGDTIKIEIKASSNGGGVGEIILHSLAIWDKADYLVLGP